MKKIFALLLLVVSLTTFAQDKIKVACIGNSITAGYLLKDKNNAYPSQLQRLLGDRYEVRNYGVSARTLLKKGDKPYWKEKAFADALAWLPNLVIIKLGTNDTKPQNWVFKADFEPDYRDLTLAFRSLSSQPKIWLCLPIPVFKNNYGISDSILKTEIIPVIQRVAKTEKLPVIDLYSALQSFSSHMADGVHPDSTGAARIAQTVYRAIK